jgi:hypothetical protein
MTEQTMYGLIHEDDDNDDVSDGAKIQVLQRKD